MKDYSCPIPPRYAHIQPITRAEAESLARSFLGARGIEATVLDLWLLVHFVAVFHFAGTEPETGRRAYGWVVGGRLPHLELSDLEIQTPIEALAIYALYERDWLNAKGVSEKEGSIPVYRVPPDWEPLSFDPGFDDLEMGTLTSFLAWNLIPSNVDALLHPEIREKCVRRGWIGRGGEPSP